MAGQMIVKRNGIEINAENGTLIGFVVGMIIPVILLLVTGVKFGAFGLIGYLVLSVIGVVAFGFYSQQKQAKVFWAGLMVVCGVMMIFVLPIAGVISVGIVIGAGMLLLKALTHLQER